MKKTVLFFFLLLFLNLQAQEHPTQKLDSKINDVTVFLNKAQITRTKQVAIPKGDSEIRFINLSPFIDPKSIQVTAPGKLMILSVDHELNYEHKTPKPSKLKDLENQYQKLLDNIKLVQTQQDIINEQIDFLQKNKVIGGKNQALTVNAVKTMGAYYAQKLSDLKMQELQQTKKLTDLKKKKARLQKKLQKFSGLKIYPTGEIVIKLTSKQAFASPFKITYNVNNASWFPDYTIRVNDIEKPLFLTYKANINQTTQIDWNKVNLTLSSDNPSISNKIPKLKTYRLGYGTYPPVYGDTPVEISGTVYEEGSNDPLPGVNINVKGTSIGAATDFDGKYKIMLPKIKNPILVFSYVGYKTVENPANHTPINIWMKTDGNLNEVVVSAMGISAKSKSRDDENDVLYVEEPMKEEFLKKNAEKNIEIPLEMIDNQTNVSFKIKRPYTIKSEHKTKIVPIKNRKIPATYEYISVPKINKNAYLTANIKDWEQYNLLSGEANVFIEGTSTGKTLLDTSRAKDTLNISLGVDKGIRIERKSDKKFTGRKFLGSKRTEERRWHIRVKNNKHKNVHIKIYDQVPVSERNDVTVEVIEKSGGQINKETGEVIWNLILKPSESKDLILHYIVKLPKYDQLIIE